MVADTEYETNIRLVATPIESMTKMLSPVIGVQSMINTMPLPLVSKHKGLSARKTSKPDVTSSSLFKEPIQHTAGVVFCWTYFFSLCPLILTSTRDH